MPLPGSCRWLFTVSFTGTMLAALLCVLHVPLASAHWQRRNAPPDKFLLLHPSQQQAPT
jgi:hypothetical protein